MSKLPDDFWYNKRGVTYSEWWNAKREISRKEYLSCLIISGSIGALIALLYLLIISLSQKLRNKTSNWKVEKCQK